MRTNSVWFSLMLFIIVFVWIIRGKYDQSTILEGRFHIVNLESSELDISVEFPSGERKFFNKLGQGSSVDFMVKNTGEGSIKIFSGDDFFDEVGYVTSSNQLIILTLSKRGCGFSEVLLE